VSLFGDLRNRFKSGPTEVGTWEEQEKFGRLRGTGEVSGELELPEGEIAISSEGDPQVGELEVELRGPDDSAVELERDLHGRDQKTRGGQNLYRLARARTAMAGTHRLRVRSPRSDESLVIAVGEEAGIGDAAEEVLPGLKLLNRLRGG
jgi:hypothetical protein